MEIKEFFIESTTPYSVLTEPYEHYVEFTIYGGIGDYADKDPLFKGYIKWDGCSNWEFPESIHFCGNNELKRFGELLTLLFDWAAKLMPNKYILDEQYDNT